MSDRGVRPLAVVDPRWERRFRAVSAVLSAGVVAIGLLVLVGWIFDIMRLKSVFPTFATMKASTAVLFVVLGIGLWLARSRAPRAIRAKRTLGLLVALGAVVTLAEYLFTLDLGIDELLFRDTRSAAFPGRMAPVTGLTFLLLGLALCLADRPLPPVVSRAAALLAEVSALIALFGYLYGAPSLYAVGIHHRVKNNLQVISRLFYLQAQRSEHESVRRLLDESRGRLQSIALIHEKLYRSEQLASIDFGDYLRDLTANLTSAIGVQAPYVEVRVEAEEIFLDIDRAIPCALIVNELVSNSMKHGFPGRWQGEICIAVVRTDSELVVEVSDTGIGFPADLDFQNVTTLGLQLVMSLTRQLRGAVELVRGGGTTFRIHVPAHALCDHRR